MSKVLILTICSNHKVKSDNLVEYKSSWRVSDFLPRDLASDLYKARRQVRDLITSNKASRNGIPLHELPYNQHIVDGLDFRGTTRRGFYLPALQRYNGRFYEKLGDQSARASLSAKIKHHLLIVSGLYGLLTPTELTQCYDCHIPDHPDIAKYWTTEVNTDLLTSLVIGYIKKCGIVKVFDFMGVDDYRKLISWEMIRHATGNNVLHCYSKQFAGADLLPSLGSLAKKFLTEMSETELMKVKAEETIKVPNDEITFLPFPMPEPPLAREISEQATVTSVADTIGRMRRNILRFVDVAVAPRKYHGFKERVEKLKARGHNQDVKMARLMMTFENFRNGVEYDNLKLSEEQRQKVCSDYAIIVKWAQRHSYYQKAKALEDVEY